MITTKQASSQTGLSASRLRYLASNGRIPGASKFGDVWVFPSRVTVTKATLGRPRKVGVDSRVAKAS